MLTLRGEIGKRGMPVEVSSAPWLSLFLGRKLPEGTSNACSSVQFVPTVDTFERVHHLGSVSAILQKPGWPLANRLGWRAGAQIGSNVRGIGLQLDGFLEMR